MKRNNTKGISLIVLVITIIVVIIIAAAVILTLTSNNPISEARKATFLNDIDTFRNELDLYNASQYASRMGEYDLSTADFSVAAGNLYTAIPSLEGKTKYLNDFEVIDGGLAYTGTAEEEITWAKDIAGLLTTNAKPELTLTTSNILPVKAGGSVAYTVAMSATVPITTVNLTGNVKVLNNAGTEIATQPSISVGTVSGTTADKTRSVVVTINTTGMTEGTYKIKVLAEAVQTAGSKNAEKISLATFEIDNTAPAMPTITINPTTWTNGDITATITKSNAADTLEYSTNGTTWNAYSTTVTITSNLTLYARETDSANNTSAQASQTITIIDKTVPNVATINNIDVTESLRAKATVTATDAGSGINVSQSKYVLTTQSTAYATTDATWNTATAMTAATQNVSLTAGSVGNYYIQVLSTDNAGNKVVTVSSVMTLKLGNAPVLAAGMTPIKWNASGVLSTTTSADAAWYNYSSKQWANAQTADGSMWVWIPRYEYQIPSTHSASAQTINANFISGTGTTATGGYTMHPAFTFGSTQVKGIWVAKFKASNSVTAIRCTPGANAQMPTINDAFTYSLSMQTTYGAQYGWGTTGTGIDTHLMKNIEWGAAAYLAYSPYGKNSQVWNGSYAYITGYTQSYADSTSNGGYQYNDMTYGINGSTTGNCFGVYDMAGPYYEWTAAYVNNSYANSYAPTMYSAAAQYKDIYTVTSDDYTTNYNNASGKKGDALYEVSNSGWGAGGWNNDYVYMPYSSSPFFTKGGVYSWGTPSGIFNTYYMSTGNYCFRPVLLVDSTL